MKKSDASAVVSTMARWPSCQACGLPHWSTKKSGVCLACNYFDLVRIEKGSFGDAISFLQSSAMCAYCGDYATDVEHVVPRHTRLPTYTLPSCRECNGLAGGILFRSFRDKSAYIKSKILKRYGFVLKTPEWDREELREMGYAMRKQIEAYEAARKSIRRRIDWDWMAVGGFDG